MIEVKKNLNDERCGGRKFHGPGWSITLVISDILTVRDKRFDEEREQTGNEVVEGWLEFRRKIEMTNPGGCSYTEGRQILEILQVQRWQRENDDVSIWTDETYPIERPEEAEGGGGSRDLNGQSCWKDPKKDRQTDPTTDLHSQAWFDLRQRKDH